MGRVPFLSVVSTKLLSVQVTLFGAASKARPRPQALRGLAGAHLAMPGGAAFVRRAQEWRAMNCRAGFPRSGHGAVEPPLPAGHPFRWVPSVGMAGGLTAFRTTGGMRRPARTPEYSHLPRGIDQYVEERRAANGPAAAAEWAPTAEKQPTPGAQLKAERKETRRIEKELRRVERELEALNKREGALHEEMAEAATEFERLSPLQKELAELTSQKQALEGEWLEHSEALEART